MTIEPDLVRNLADIEVPRLAKLSALQYEHDRCDVARAFGVRTATLDRMVKAARDAGKDSGQGSRVLFEEVEPAAVAVPLAELLTSISAVYSQHVVLPPHAADAAALWTVATWATDHTDCAPILLLKSPEPRCGKSTLLGLLDMLCRRPLPVANVSPAAVFRVVEQSAPTLLIDEGDAFLAGNEELRGIINCGHTRSTAYVLRTVGEDFEPRRFAVFGPKALAMIGKAPHTITDRSIIIELRRKLPSERATKLRDAPKVRIAELRASLARWALDDSHRIAEARPQLPDELNDRAGDSWGPLLAVADLAEDEWPDRARAAAVAISGDAHTEDASIGAELLADVRRVFDHLEIDRVAGADLLKELLVDEERPWATINHGKPMSQAQLARRLSAFGITSRSVRLPDGRTPKGYPREAFDDAFARYLASTPYQSATPPQTNDGAGCGTSANRHNENVWHFEKTPQTNDDAGCGGVALSNPLESENNEGLPL